MSNNKNIDVDPTMQSCMFIVMYLQQHLVLDWQWAVFTAFEVSRRHGLKANFPEVKQENSSGIYGYKPENVACLSQYCCMKTILLLPGDMSICTHLCKPSVFNGLAQVGLFEVLKWLCCWYTEQNSEMYIYRTSWLYNLVLRLSSLSYGNSGKQAIPV